MTISQNYIRFLITTSRHDSIRTRSFCNDLSFALPNAVKINRGKMSIKNVLSIALENQCERVLIVSTINGNPGKIVFYSIENSKFKVLYPSIHIVGVKLMFEIYGSKKIHVNDLVILCQERIFEDAKILCNLFGCERIIFENDVKDLPDNTSILNLNIINHSHYLMSFTNSYGIVIGPVIRIKRF